jgi:hypothetical protein
VIKKGGWIVKKYLVVLLAVFVTMFIWNVSKNSASPSNTSDSDQNSFYTEDEKLSMRDFVKKNLLKKESLADLLMYNGMYYRNINDDKFSSFIKYSSGKFKFSEQVGEITANYNLGEKFVNGMATKLPVGAKIFAIDGERPSFTMSNAKGVFELSVDVLTVKVDGKEFIYESVLAK